jgi:hypothetical protein
MTLDGAKYAEISISSCVNAAANASIEPLLVGTIAMFDMMKLAARPTF